MPSRLARNGIAIDSAAAGRKFVSDHDNRGREKSMAFSRRAFLRAAVTSAAACYVGSGASSTLNQDLDALVPEAFGAAGDGTADDTAALQALFRAASGLAPRPVMLGRGRTYRITASGTDSVILPLARGIRIAGNGATLRIADGSRGFHAIIGSRDSAVDLSGLWIEGVIFDHNAQNEHRAPVVSGSVLTLPRCTVKAKRGAGLAFVGNVVRNAMSTNCVEFNGDGNTSATIIRNNRFLMAEPRSNIYFDHSTLYLTGDDIEITNNVLENASWGSANGTCAIEVHPGRGYVVRGNRVLKYHTGINVAGIYETDSRQGIVSDNQLEVLRRGIAIYSGVYLTHRNGYGIDGLEMDANIIRIRNASPRRSMLGGGPGVFGIGFVGGASLPVRNVRFGPANRITFDLERSPPDWDSLAAGVSLGETESRAVFEDIRIEALEIVNSPVFGIMIGSRGGVYRNCSIIGARIVNPGSTARPDAMLGSTDYRTAIWISPYSLQGSLRIEGVRIVDNLEPGRMVNAIVMEARAPSDADVQIGVDISVTGRGAYRHALWKFDELLVPLVDIQQSHGEVRISPGARLRRGSRLTDRSTGRVRTIG